jgi:hypothetical protein
VVGIDHLHDVADNFRVARHQPQAAALFNVLPGVVEAEHHGAVAVDDQQLAVVAHHVVRGPRQGHADFQQPALQLAQLALAAAVGMRDERAHRHAAADGSGNRLLDRIEVEAENDDVDALLGAVDRLDQRSDTVVRLNDDLHNGRRS